MYFASYMHTMLTQYSMKINVIMIDKDNCKENLQHTTDLMQEIEVRLHKIQADEIVQTQLVDMNTFHILDQKKVKSQEELLQWVKYQTYLNFNIPENATFINDLEKKLLLDASKLVYEFKNLKTLITTYKTIEEQIEYSKEKHIEQYNDNLDNIMDCHVTYGSTKKSIEEQLKALRMSTNPNRLIKKMLSKDMYLKQYYTLRAMQSIGLRTIMDENNIENPYAFVSEHNQYKKLKTNTTRCQIKNPYKKVSKFLNENQEELLLIFPSSFQFDKIKQQSLTGYARYINLMLSIFGLQFVQVGTHRNKQYVLDFKVDFKLFQTIKDRVKKRKTALKDTQQAKKPRKTKE